LTVIFRSQFYFNSIAAGIGCLIGLAPGLVGSALAMDITIVRQTGSEFICMFNADCRSGPATGGGITPPWPSSDQRLSASTFTASSGSPADGTTVYLYRLDLTRDHDKNTECVAGVSLDFGPLAQIPPVTANKAHVYVITTGDAAGTIPIKSAEQDGDLIELSFDADLCGSKSSLMFALPSNFPPTQGRGAILQFGKTPLSPTKIFAPKHPGAQTAPSNTDDPQ
jgi:hypothetical protein